MWGLEECAKANVDIEDRESEVLSNLAMVPATNLWAGSSPLEAIDELLETCNPEWAPLAFEEFLDSAEMKDMVSRDENES